MKTSKLSILATTAILFTPISVFAQNAQTSVQGNHNSAAGVGYGNVLLQNADQDSTQTQADFGGYGYDAPESQLSIQGNVNEAAAIGEHNAIIQNADQDSYQTQVDVGGYVPSYGY